MPRYCRHKEGVLNLETTALAVESVTYAIKARKLLRQAGIRSKLIKPNDNVVGCGYALEIYRSDFLAAVAVLRKNLINYTVR